MTKANIGLIYVDKTGTLESRENLNIVPKDIEAKGNITGGFDKKSGTFELSIPGLGTLEVSGIPSIDSMGYGPSGDTGRAGKNGDSGIIKDKAAKGSQGDRGKSGERGINGYLGFRGYQGFRGLQGSEGDEGDIGIEGHIPMFIQNEDPGNVPPGTIWVKRIPDIKREAVNIAAPVLLIDNVTMFLNEDRISRVRVSNNLEDILRYEIKAENDEYIESIINPITMESLGLDPSSESDDKEFASLKLSNFDFLIKLKREDVAKDSKITDRQNYTTLLNVFIESASGSDTNEIVLTIVPEERI